MNKTTFQTSLEENKHMKFNTFSQGNYFFSNPNGTLISMSGQNAGFVATLAKCTCPLCRPRIRTPSFGGGVPNRTSDNILRRMDDITEETAEIPEEEEEEEEEEEVAWPSTFADYARLRENALLTDVERTYYTHIDAINEITNDTLWVIDQET